MNKYVTLLVVIVVTVLALGSVGVAYAQSPNQAAGNGAGNRGNQGAGTMMGAGVAGTGDGILHDYLIEGFAENLNISVADLEARLAAGETLSQVALSNGLTLDEFRTLMIDVRTSALEQAVSDGVISQAQADWMSQHGFGQMGGSRMNMLGMRGAGQGQFANPECPYYQANP